MLLYAHAGHWLTGVAYFIPVIAFVVWLVITQIRERRRQGDDEGGQAGPRGA